MRMRPSLADQICYFEVTGVLYKPLKKLLEEGGSVRLTRGRTDGQICVLMIRTLVYFLLLSHNILKDNMILYLVFMSLVSIKTLPLGLYNNKVLAVFTEGPRGLLI